MPSSEFVTKHPLNLLISSGYSSFSSRSTPLLPASFITYLRITPGSIPLLTGGVTMQMLNDACPNDQVIKLKALEAMQKVADGKATKIIIPSELQGLAGLATGLVETVREPKQ